MRRTVLSLTSVVLALLLACVVSLLVVGKPAEAAFPGTNGKIVFWSDRSPTTSAGPGLYTITAAGGTATKIPGTSQGDNQAVWSPDGSRIVFQSTSATNKEISVMKADGGGRKQLTATPVPEQEPTWSPDGSRIAFAAGTSDTDATTDLEIWVMNADGSGLTQLTNNAGGSDDTEPAWSPLGNQIAFRGDGQPSDTNNNIYVMDTDPTTNDAVNLTPNDFTVTPVYQFNEESPSWSPDGTQITYSTSLDIWKMDTNAATTDWTNLTKTPTTNDTHPSWAPDDDSIVYSRTDVDNGVNNPNIYVVGAGGGTQTPVDTTPRKDEKPNWQPIPVCTQNVNDNNDPLVGTAGKDVLCGDNRNNTIKGTGGNDIILGKGGNDKLTGALGNDTLNGGPGTDTTLYTDSTAVKANLTTEFATGVGSDVLLAVENLTGSGGDDRLAGSADANVLVGGAGADDLFGLGGADTLNSKDGISSNDTLSGRPGTDTCIKDATEVSITSCP